MLSVSKETEQVILGGLLGDSGISKNKQKHYLYMHHSHKQLEYLKWKVSFFDKDQLSTPKGIYLNQYNTKYISYRYYTKSIPYFTPYHKLFYDKKKVVTRHILNRLEPLGLAVWYMDDGTRQLIKVNGKNGNRLINGRTISIATCNFTYDEHLIMQQYFDVVWGLQAKIRKVKQYYKILFNATNAKKFIKIVEPYIIPSMDYKIDLQYNVMHPVNQDDDVL